MFEGLLMDKFFSIAPVKQEPFIITWDLGRRCNYDCSYCPPHRHDNFSSHASLDELKDTTEFLFEYISTIAAHRKYKDFHVSFTGGEPTVNPNFIEFTKYIRQRYNESFSSRFNIFFDLTTNGAMSEKIAASVIENFHHVTVSYHPEAAPVLKQQVLDRIRQFKDSKIIIKVNVMFHAEMFDECKEFCNALTNEGVKFIPRTIGENPEKISRFSHSYSEEQKQWFKDFWKIDIQPGMRPCCGGRPMSLCSSSGTVESKVVNFREFQGWHCSVNWYFLHIEQQTKLIYHHQTCQATLDGKRGSIGDLANWKLLVDSLKEKLAQKSMPIVVCPNRLCGCGLCTPKSVDRDVLVTSMSFVLNDTEVFSKS